MNPQIVSALVVKDLSLFFRNRFFALITMLALVFYALIYFIMPSSVDEFLELGLYAPQIPPILSGQMENEGLRLVRADSEEALIQAVDDGEVKVGVVIPADLQANLAAGEKERINIYFSASLPAELEGVYDVFLQELAFMMVGQPLQLETVEEILGRDMAGEQIPQRDRMIPLFAVFMLMMETIGLASLISAEVEAGTLQALFVTPLRVEGLFLSKGITGVGLAFVQVALFLLVTGSLAQQPVLILATMLVGSILVTGLAFLLSSASKDMVSVMARGILALLILAIPSFGVMFPGAVSDWVKIIPSYYMVDTVHQAANLGAGWGDLWANLVILSGFSALFFALGIVALKRKFR
jgi:ABC-2 type transport system permease protein